MNSIGRILLVASVFLVAGCRIDTSQPAAATAQSESATPVTTAAVSVTSLDVPSNGLGGETAIADNFDGSSGIATGMGLPSVSGDGTAAFRMFCTAGQLVNDDPLVMPGQPGASHLHQFVGNTGTNASSNYQSLRTSGGTTCGTSAAPFNRTAYWFPAMLDGVGNVVKPDFMSLYYKRNSGSDPMCRPLSSAYQSLGQCTDLPNGIRMVMGYNMQTMTPGPDGSVNFVCWGSEDGTVGSGTATAAVYHSIAEVAAAGCPVGAQLVILINGPNCWDGQSLDTADHRSHMSYAYGPWYVNQQFNACTADHPYPIPDVELLIHYTVDANFAKWHVSSDEMLPGAPNGSTMHADYWEAWSPTIKAAWEHNCIDGHYSSANGFLCDGTAIKGADVPWGGFPKHQLIALSSIPGATTTPTTTPTTKVCADGSVILISQTCPVTSPSPTPKTSGGKALGRKK